MGELRNHEPLGNGDWPTPEENTASAQQHAASNIRKKLDELNQVVADAVRLNMEVEYDTLYDVQPQGTVSVLTAKVKVII